MSVGKHFFKATATILICVVAVAACQRDNAPAPKVAIPDFLTTYEMSPFGSDEFHLFKKVFDPLWDALRLTYDDLQLVEVTIPLQITPQQARSDLSRLLSRDWHYDEGLSQNTRWGWSVGFKQGNYVYTVFAAHGDKKPGLNSAVLPAGIITNAEIANRLR